MNTLLIYKPVTPSQRHMCLVNKRAFAHPAVERLMSVNGNKAGRNHHGHITVRHHGAGNRKRYRIIDQHRQLCDIPGTVKTIEYDPYRSGFISLIYMWNGLYCYILSTQELLVDDIVTNHINSCASYKNGDSSVLNNIEIGTRVCNIENSVGHGFTLVKSSGTTALLLRNKHGYSVLRLPSGKKILISSYVRAVLGQVSNRENKYTTKGKAGRSRVLGIRPTVRGVAMNPVDHPHGGGEGKKSKKASPRTPWGKRN